MKNVSPLFKRMIAFIFILSFFSSYLKAQGCFVQAGSICPTTKGIYINPPPVFDNINNRYRFHSYGSDTVSYSYYLNATGMLSALKMETGSTSFTPLSYAAPLLHVASVNINVFGWNPNVGFTLLSYSLSGDTLIANWKMKYVNGPTSDSITFTYKLHVQGKTMIVRATSLEAKCAGFDMCRSEGTTNPKIIPIPYYLGSVVLKTNSYYLCAFSDWETSNASEFHPGGSIYSPTSAYFTQFINYNTKSDGTYNLLNERFYVTASKDITETFPNSINPLTPNRDSSANYIVYDQWTNCCPWSFTMIGDSIMSRLYQWGIRHLWLIDHQWQNQGYDVGYPDVMPAYPGYGGNVKLKELADSVHSWGYKFTLHENYWDYSKSAPISFTLADVALNPNGTYCGGAPNYLGDTMYLLKNSKIAHYINTISPQIHSTFNTDGAYLDVHSAANPFYGVDYDASVSGAGKYTEVIKKSRLAAGQLRAAHGNGLISGEGRFHFLYAGYYDDFESEIDCAMGGGYDGYFQGVRLPLLLDYKLNKIHQQTPMHGVGYYERFFSWPSGATRDFPANKDTTLIYMATELAYGNCGFVPRFGASVNQYMIAKLEMEHTLRVQKYYYDQCATSILYNDNGNMLTSSQFINNHPQNFDSISSPNFLSQVQVQYSNGVIVYVNRNRFNPWTVTLPTNTGILSFHAIVNSVDSLYYGYSPMTTFTLPANNGWVVYIPGSLSGVEGSSLNIDNLEVSCFPNPFTDEIKITVGSPADPNGSIEIFDLVGRMVYKKELIFYKGKNTITWNGENSSGGKCGTGVYFVKVTAGDKVSALKVVKQ